MDDPLPADSVNGLQGIAEQFNGNSRLWPVIFEANRHVIGHDPAVLRAG